MRNRRLGVSPRHIGFLLEFSEDDAAQKQRWKKFDDKCICLDAIPQRDGETDGQTDGRNW